MADTPDSVAETVPEAPAPIPATTPDPAPRTGSAVMPVVGGIVAAVIGFGVAQLVPDLWPKADVSALETRLADQEAQIAALKTEMAKLAESGQPAPDAQLLGRVMAVETAIDGLAAPDLTGLTGRLDALDQKIAVLAATPAQSSGGVDSAAVAALQAEIEALKSGTLPQQALDQAAAAIDTKLAEVDARLATVKQEAEAIAAGAARAAALGQVMAALDSGAPYAAALADLGDGLPAVIADNAKTGLPSLESLRTAFPEAARAALDASLRANPGESWTDRVATFLRGQTGARSLAPREGSDPDAVLSRAEAALTAGDLTTALQEVQGLPPEGQAAMASWTARATLRAEAATALQALAVPAGQ